MYCDKLTERVLVASDAPVVETKKGKIAGVKKQGSYIFRGIKYGTARRFHMPEEVEAWEDIKAAVAYGYVCPEFTTPIPEDYQLIPRYYMPQDEECQYLNIWTQTLDPIAKKPVMIWMHGGGWTTGSGVEQFAYDGEELSNFGDVVIVSFNHRLNCLAGLDLSAYDKDYDMSAYCGLGDIIMLLRWVKENIGAFGGNPENITVFGQSGGVAKILYTMQCPFADNLFQKAAIDSGGIKEQVIPEGWTKKKLAQKIAQYTVKNLDLNSENIREIETVSYWDLAEAVMKAEAELKEKSGLKGFYRWEPVEDGKFVIGSTLKDGFRKETKYIPMLIGNVFGEAHSNVISGNVLGDGDKNNWDNDLIQQFCHDKFGEHADELLREFEKVYPENNPADLLFMDYEERAGQIGLVKQRVNMGADVWNWLFKKESALNSGMVAWHCSEIPYIFHNTSYIEAAYEPGVSEYIEEIMCSAWVNFAKTGNPNDSNIVPPWERVTSEKMTTMIFDTKCEARVNHDNTLRKLLWATASNKS